MRSNPVNGDSAYWDGMNEVALFESALRAAVPTQPDPMIADRLVPRLARIARTATIEVETRLRTGGVARAGIRERSRRALVARVGIAMAAIPLAFVGLALAGVTVPGPARDAFDSVGVTLPNQPAEHSENVKSPGSQGGGNDVSDAAKTQGAHPAGEGNSAAAHVHALQQRSKARGEAKGHTRGKAIGLNELTPPGKSGETGAPAHSNAGSSARTQSLQPIPRVDSTPFPRGNARGTPSSPITAARSPGKSSR
jgi:hypothetical protein